MTWIAEAGLAALCLGFMASLLLAGLALAMRNSPASEQALPRIALLAGGAVVASFLLLCVAYLLSDFSVANVYENSHTAKPLLYKLTGTWGNHEGSMLLWVMLLALFTLAYALRPNRHVQEKSAVLGVLGGLIAGFTLFILLTSNPFIRLSPVPFEGKSLNPLLQDIGLALHPPLLYLGYVGFAVVFAQAVAALLSRQPIDTLWARQVRPWALLAWAFLTAGIGLGSWWAYRELGWGGWWFWDPVENISLLPWLSATALLHCLLILAKRSMLQNWTLLLAIFTFTFSLLGTFLVRSGLLTSVHSFASDPARGIYILGFITMVTGGSLWLYAVRYPRPAAPDFLPVSREGGIMVNNLLLVTLCVTVFLGIIYPILLQVFNLPSVSVGAPFYNRVVVPVGLPLLLLAGFAPFLAWKRSGWNASRRLLRHAVFAALAIAVAAAVLFAASLPALLHMPMAVLAAGCGIWLMAATVIYARKLYHAANKRLTLAVTGMLLAHAGLGVFALAAALASAGRIETERQFTVGQTANLAGYEVELARLDVAQAENYTRTRATLYLTHLSNGESLTLYPETRYYPVRQMETAESALHSSITGDVYTAIATAADLGDSNERHKMVTLRLYILPAIGWIWAGFIMVSLGGFAAAYGYFREHRKKPNGIAYG